MHGHTVFLATCINVSQCLIQGVDKTDSPLLQIPHVTDREVDILTTRAAPTKSVYDFVKLDADAQSALLPSFTNDQFQDVQAFC